MLHQSTRNNSSSGGGKADEVLTEGFELLCLLVREQMGGGQVFVEVLQMVAVLSGVWGWQGI